MPITYEIHAAHQRVVAMVTGPVGPADATAFLAALVEHGAAPYALRMDASDAEILCSADQIRRLVPLVGRLRAVHGHTRSAFISTADVTFGMARMYATLAAESDSGFMVCRTVKEADAWLGWTESIAQHQPS